MLNQQSVIFFSVFQIIAVLLICFRNHVQLPFRIDATRPMLILDHIWTVKERVISFVEIETGRKQNWMTWFHGAIDLLDWHLVSSIDWNQCVRSRAKAGPNELQF